MTGFGAFPSDHAALFFALAVGLFAWSRRAGLSGLLLASVFSVARVVVGFHYPSDMVAGAAMGAALAGGAMLMARGPQPVLDGVVQLFVRRPAIMYPLLFVVALDFTQHFRLVFRAIFYFLFGLLGGR
jgi:undecaprenyl-diphosphatase